MTRQVLLVDDDLAVREALGQTFQLAGLEPVLTGSYIEAKDHITKTFDGVIISDIRMPGKDGFELLTYARGVDPDLPVILLTGEGDIPMAVRGMSEGAFEFLEKPCAPSEILAIVEKALRTRTLVLENRRLRRMAETGDAAARILMGDSAKAHDLRNQARLAARTQAWVLITGEHGTGISKVAEVIHLLSGAAMRPFVKCSAAALDASQLAKEIEKADGGTLFLDEVTGLSPALQNALLERVEDIPRCRIIAGTHRDLDYEVQEGHFISDLAFRLQAIRIAIPALRERAEDIPALFRHYVSLTCEQADLPKPDIPQEYLARIMVEKWPGNAHALMNAAMRFAMGLSEPVENEGLGLAEQMAQVEKSLLIDALRRNDGAASATAQMLKLPRKTFYDKLARHGIRPEDYRS
ncbi:sigma-54-dependent transcriptional regulator [Actibacterium pelagium]|uniref:Transcriptional regulator n=1 Tax=Actibacterium pelagium TaxID=2029103 RepID=A0A917AHZ5_9RHOB|nr:sigma-54 dependent transcriptional regulator [Actibacterium pelagium]GGE49913.1 transcriptional regulator [Actibacterium pelagium]